MTCLATFDWPGESWTHVVALAVEVFAERYEVPARLVPTLLRKQAAGDHRPVEWRPESEPEPKPKRRRKRRRKRKAKPKAKAKQASEMDKITVHLEEFNARPAEEPAKVPTKVPTRKQRRLRRRLLQRVRVRERERAKRKTEPVVLYACRAKHHEHCAGQLRGAKCACRCHLSQHEDWLARRRRAWEEQQHALEAEIEERPRPATDAELSRANQMWKEQQRGLDEVRKANRRLKRSQLYPGPSLATHPITEEDVEAISDVYENLVYQFGWSLDRRIEEKGEQALRAWKRLPKYTDARAKPDPWTKDKRRRINPVRTRRMGRPRVELTEEEREQQRAYSRGRYRANRALGLCGHCGTYDLDGGTEAQCAECLAKDRERHVRYYARRAAAGLPQRSIREQRERAKRPRLRAVRQQMVEALSSVGRRLAEAIDAWDAASWE